MSGKEMRGRAEKSATDEYLKAMVERYAANAVEMVNKIVVFVRCVFLTDCEKQCFSTEFTLLNDEEKRRLADFAQDFRDKKRQRSNE
jgi:hypothetical protein